MQLNVLKKKTIIYSKKYKYIEEIHFLKLILKVKYRK